MAPSVPLHSKRSLAVAFLVFSIALVGVIVTSPAAHAANRYVSGPIGVDTTWLARDTYFVTGHVTVKGGVTLTIEAGTHVRFDFGTGLFVEGTLWADGAPGNPIQFMPNATVLPVPWYGIQFNASSTGSVSQSFFSGPDRAVAAMDSSPAIFNNAVQGATWGFALVRSTTLLADNAVDRAVLGIYLSESDAQVVGNWINGTNGFAIRAETSGSPVISGNSITNTKGSVAIGIYSTGAVTPTISSNSIQGIQGRNGTDAAAAGAPGEDGGLAIGILVDGGASATVVDNAVNALRGGRGGNGAPSSGGVGGRGGNAGSAAGIVVANVGTVDMGWNFVTNLYGGRGGMGGQLAGTSTGGNGGDAGDATAFQVFNIGTAAWTYGNYADGINAGIGGHGGDGTLFDGFGGLGGDALGLFGSGAMDVDASSNQVQNIRGGLGGNSTLLGGGNRAGGAAGAGTGVALFGSAGSTILHSNTVVAVTGGAGGRGSPGGRGGDGTGALVFGYNDGKFNSTSASSNTVGFVSAGNGGNGAGATRGGDGGTATGLGLIRVSASLASNDLFLLVGGAGGDGVVGGRGGDASGIAAVLLKGTSVRDSVSTVFRGTPGSPPPSEVARGIGFFSQGNASFTARFTIDNGTATTIADYDFFAGDYAGMTAINSSVVDGWLRVDPAGTLTVRNYLGVDAFWPNGVTPVPGATVHVDDNGATVWNFVSSSGSDPWLLVTDRVYINSNVATENATDVLVTYLTYSFLNNPRSVDMSASHTESFVMVDQDAPSSQAGILPIYTTTLTFTVTYAASDGTGLGLSNITLWYRRDGGGWIRYATQPAANGGSFNFAAASEATYEFQTVAEDRAGNLEPGPATNDTWTIVDTTRPFSRVLSLGTYQTSTSFVVSWGPQFDTTDIASYRIEVRDNGGVWTDWFASTDATSSVFNGQDGHTYEFRSTARDWAGNTETPLGTNDTWTIVDASAPTITVFAPSGTSVGASTPLVITFSEPMNTTATEAAILFTPGLTGAFSWNANRTALTFVAFNPMAGQTQYTIQIGSGARDRAGNALTQRVFQFTTVASVGTGGLNLSDFWWLLLVVAGVVGGALFLILRRRTGGPLKPAAPVAAPKESESILEDVFLLNHRDGLLIKHETRRLRPDVDTDILSGMLTAVQQFVKDALRGDEYAELNEMTVGHMHILIGRGKWLVLAARIEGDGSEQWTVQIERCIKDMEDHHWDQLEEWDGDMTLARVLTPYIKKLIQGGYVSPVEGTGSPPAGNPPGLKLRPR